MKYFCHINQKWDYDELEDEEVLVFSCPNKFSFSNVEIMKEVLTKMGYSKISVEDFSGSDGKIHKFVKAEGTNYWGEFFSLDVFLNYKIKEREVLIEILARDYNVKLLKLEFGDV